MNEQNANTIYIYIYIAIRFKINHRNNIAKPFHFFKHNCEFILSFTPKYGLSSTAK